MTAARGRRPLTSIPVPPSASGGDWATGKDDVLDLRRLKYFVSIVDCGSMSAASRALGVAQPALSHHIAELERIIGFALLERLARGVRPTERGAVLVRHARTILAEVDEAERTMRELRRMSVAPRVVRLALIASWATSFTPVIAAEVRKRMPNTTLHILETRDEEAVRMVEADVVDLAVSLTPGPDPARELVVREALYLVAPVPGADQVRFGDLAEERLLLPFRSNPLRAVIDETALRAGVALTAAMEIDGQDTVKRAVQAGMGLSILSWNSVKQECARGVLFASRIVEPEVDRPIYLRRSSTVETELYEIFRDILRDIGAASTGNP